MNIFSPVKGELKPIEEVQDEVFSLKIMGDGVALVPEEDTIVSPVDAIVTAVFPTGHAVGLQTADGVELLLHLGVDTVEMNGQCFSSKITQGQVVKTGDVLVEMDCQGVKEAGYENDVILIITNTNGQEVEKTSDTRKVTNEDIILIIK